VTRIVADDVIAQAGEGPALAAPGRRAHPHGGEPLMHGEPAEAAHSGERGRDEHPIVPIVAERSRDEAQGRANAQGHVAERRLAACHPANDAGQLESAARFEALLGARNAAGELRGRQGIVQRDGERPRPA
jgi:hypothetical protein